MLLALCLPAAAVDEVATYGVENWDTCCASCGWMPWNIDASEAVFDVFAGWISEGKWDYAYEFQNGAVDGIDWTDFEERDWGKDDDAPYGADASDVAFMFSHGGSNCWSGGGSPEKMWFVSGDISGQEPDLECRPDSDDAWQFGDDDDDLEIVVMNSCHSADTCAWNGGAFSLLYADRLHGADLRAYMGFHGVMYNYPWSNDVMDTYVSTSRLNGLGSHWLAELWEDSIFDDADQCPVSIIWGITDQNVIDYHTGGGFGDRDNPTPHQSKRRVFMSGCDPDEGGTL